MSFSAFNSFNSPFWNFFDNINDEVEQFNRLLASSGFNDGDRIKVSRNPAASSSKKITATANDSSDNNKVATTSNANNNNSLTFPTLFNSPFFSDTSFDIVPPVDVLDNKTNYELHVSIPGVDKDAVNIDFNPTTNQITISGEVPAHSNESNLKINERSTGKFQRVVKLPNNPKVDEANIKASYSKGVLVLNVPKLQAEEEEGPKSFKIEISSSDSWSTDQSTNDKAKGEAAVEDKKDKSA